MATLAELEAQLEMLQRARDTGVLQIRKGEDSTLFRSLKEMDEAIRGLELRIRRAKGGAAKTYRMVRFNDRSGY
ncbi:hypothetical protein AA309_20175 [Microvirga vignae]|uniref:Uncharacterized protein n=1 Tax=Microvirga vignae TaxID=1225564 RepID=A0A0H1R9A1_9HYPH|nr:hypothetical protein [Microvirga vignae]KLK91416.1 hypothetical protein AA309_20175 [Microvirga vignae]